MLIREKDIPYYTQELYHSDDYLMHYGKLGMKWGVRRYQNSDGTLTPKGQKKYSQYDTIKSKKTGEEIYLAKRRRLSDNNSYTFDILTKGKKVGDLFLDKHGKDLNINYITIKKKQRGKGYANSVMDYIIKYGKKNNYKSLSLEVPDEDNDARHIYNKKGFKVNKKKTKKLREEVGILTAMEKKLK